MQQLRILMCCQFPLLASLGGPKGYIEIAQTYRMKGHFVKLVGINEIVGDDSIEYHEDWRLNNFAEYLRNYILKHTHLYDVIEYEAIYLPFNLKDKVTSVLVARSVLLELHFLEIKIPILPHWKAYLSHVVKYYSRKSSLQKRIKTFLLAMKYADVVNVSNPSDRDILIKHGVTPEKIVFQPYGLTQLRYNQLQSVRLKASKTLTPKIAFIGSFDRRKGAAEFPLIVETLRSKIPSLKFKLLGVLGLFRSSEAIYHFFGEKSKNSIEIIERYAPEELGDLLSDCSIGIFPSHLESFGFGALEMMASGMAVVGYDVPGINMLLPPDLLVKRGDRAGICEKIFLLLSEELLREKYAQECLTRAKKYIYESQENYSLQKYVELKSKHIV